MAGQVDFLSDLAAAGPSPAQDPAQNVPGSFLADLAAAPPAAAPQAPPPQTGLWHLQAVGRLALEHPLTAGLGMGENALSGISGAVGKLAGRFADLATGTPNNRAQSWEQAAQYQPRLAAGQDIQNLTSQEGAKVGGLMDQIPGVSTPIGQTLKEAVPEFATDVGLLGSVRALPGAVSNVRAAFKPSPPPLSTQDLIAQTRMNSPQSMGAAAAAPSLTNVSPELQQAISKAAQKTGGAINPDVLSRHLEADSLPVKVQLTEGQATQDPVILSNEMNVRAKHPQLATRFNDQNGQLVQNVQTIRDTVGPDVFSTNPAEHGDTLIAAYKAKDAAAQNDITGRYQALKDANGGQFPVDAQALLTNASAQLHQQLLFDHAPRAVMSTLGRLADNNSMTFENFESLRTNLARIQRSLTADGNEKAAAGVIRNAMEQLPLAPAAAGLKPLADAARGAARAQFNALDADPAYKAAVNDAVPPDRFVNRFIVNAPRDDVALMRQNLANNPTATQTLGVATLDHLRNSAGIDANWNGNFSQGRFNNALQALSPKLRSLVDPKTADQLETLGNVARYTQSQPRGSFVNNSNTLVGALGSYGAGALEGAANVAAHGIPVGTWGRKAIQNVAAGKTVKQATAPGAGLTRLQPTVQSVPGLMTPQPRRGGGLLGNQ
jgi:hypothetical protein